MLRPGCVIALVDQDPGSAVIRRLPAPIATLLKSTEPHLKESFRLDLPAIPTTGCWWPVPERQRFSRLRMPLCRAPGRNRPDG